MLEVTNPEQPVEAAISSPNGSNPHAWVNELLDGPLRQLREEASLFVFAAVGVYAVSKYTGLFKLFKSNPEREPSDDTDQSDD